MSMNYFKRLYSLYRIILSLPRELKDVKSQLREVRKLQYSSIALQQKLLLENWKKEDGLVTLSDKGFRVHSQFEEDGLLLYIFSKIGFTNRKGIEMCCGWGNECMLSNLILYHSFEGLLFDGDANSVEKACQFFNSHPDSFQCPPKIVHAWITRENINHLIGQNGFSGEIDIFSLDVDGIDYYLLQALDIVSPRVVICEVHNVIPGGLALTIPYSDHFNYTDGKYDPEFRSASLLAMVKLMRNKGYRLVGSHRYGFNVIFLRNDVGAGVFPEIDHETCCNDVYTRERVKVWQRVAHLPWVDVS